MRHRTIAQRDCAREKRNKNQDNPSEFLAVQVDEGDERPI
jgi:hypothetical protein